MPVTVRTDSVRQRVLVSVPPGQRWSQMEKAIVEAVERAPRLAGWDWIIDDQGPMDDVEVGGMARIGETFRAHGVAWTTPPHTVVITTDPFFGPWAQVMDHHYGGRRHHAAPTVSAARTLLDRLRAPTSKQAGGEPPDQRRT